MANPEQRDTVVVLPPAGPSPRRPEAPAPLAPAPLARRLAWGAAALSLGWTGLALHHLSAELGWAGFAALRAHEQALIVIGIASPLAALWFAVAFVARGDEVRGVAAALRAELSALTADEGAAGGRATSPRRATPRRRASTTAASRSPATRATSRRRRTRPRCA
jgi:hypothetical protein